jgi:hypothetical protein
VPSITTRAPVRLVPSETNPMTYLPYLTQQSLRIQQVTSDLVTPSDARKKRAAAAPSQKDVIQYRDNDAQHKAVYLGGITEWLSQQLLPSGTFQARGNTP